MSFPNNEIIDSFDGSRYEITSLFMHGMVDAGFGINPRDISPTIENNDVDTLRFDYDDGYGFASDLEAYYGEDRESRLLVYVREDKKPFESDYLFRLIAIDNKMAQKISRALEKQFSGLRVSYQQFVNNNRKRWI